MILAKHVFVTFLRDYCRWNAVPASEKVCLRLRACFGFYGFGAGIIYVFCSFACVTFWLKRNTFISRCCGSVTFTLRFWLQWHKIYSSPLYDSSARSRSGVFCGPPTASSTKKRGKCQVVIVLRPFDLDQGGEMVGGRT